MVPVETGVRGWTGSEAPGQRQDQRLEGTGRPHQGGEGAAIIIDEPGAYKEP
jgi:hypothetical protein